jgi:hypothetical protein
MSAFVGVMTAGLMIGMIWAHKGTHNGDADNENGCGD